METLEKLGICVKDIDKKVISQNDLCKQCCGDKINQICDIGCMRDYSTNIPKSFSDGMTLIKNAENNLGKADTVVINDGKLITTIIYLKDSIPENLSFDMAEIEHCQLSKSEKKVLEYILLGKKNKEICKLLFISEATLKTHLNKIYKKLPEHWQVLKKRFN